MVIFIIVVPKSTDDYTFSLGTFVYGYQVMMGMALTIAEAGVS